MKARQAESSTNAPSLSARASGLRYVGDTAPGIRRVRSGHGFRYVGPHGRAVTDETTLARIRRLAIPPAWTHVWIAATPHAHLQATGRDARGRKQYRYHPRWGEIRHQTKYDRLVPFARALPQLRRRVEIDLRSPALSRTHVVAAVVQLLERTLVRIGNSEYARTNRSYGLTTLHDGHARIRGDQLQLQFRGKSGVRHSVTLSDARLARIVKRCQDLPGQELFQYVNGDGRRRAVTSADVNDYLREAMGTEFTAKDFRTWAGTLLAFMALRDEDGDAPARQRKRVIVDAVARVAHHLGNTPSVCRSCYIHPAVLEAYADDTTQSLLARPRRQIRGLTPDECAVLNLLEGRRAAPRSSARRGRTPRRDARVA